MSVYKMVDVVGTSGTSVSDAIQGAVQRAAMTLEDLSWFEVTEIRGHVKDGEVSEYQVKLELGFLLHAPKTETGGAHSARRSKKTAGRSRESRSLEAQAISRKGGKRAKNVARPFTRQ